MISLLIICFGVYGVLSSAKTWLSNRSWVQGVFGLILLGLSAWLPLEWIEKNTPKYYKKRKAENKERRLFPVKEDQDVIPPYQFRQIKALKAFINENTSQDDFIYDYSNQCAHLFFSERKSSSRFFMPVYAVLEDHQREVIENIEKKKVPYIFYQSSRSFRNVDGFPTRDRTPFLHNYILGNYSPYRWVGGIEVWKRKENP